MKKTKQKDIELSYNFEARELKITPKAELIKKLRMTKSTKFMLVECIQ
jgi:hypothetical protein